MSQQTTPLVSVILTSYNYEKYVAEAIQSVYQQHYSNVELLIVDDGSTDNSLEVIRETIRVGPFPTQLLEQSNKGQATALNTAFERVSGEVVTFLDSDDLWYPEKLRLVLQYMEQFPNGGVYQHQLNTSNGLKRNALLTADIFKLWKEWDGGVFNLVDGFDGITFGPFLPTTALALRRSILQKVFPLPEGIKTCADAFITRTATAYGPLISIPATLGMWRDHGENAGLEDANNFRNYWQPIILPALNQYYAKNGLGLRLIYDPRRRSMVSAARILGECGVFTRSSTKGSIRHQLNYGRSRLTLLAIDLLRLLLREKDIQRVRVWTQRLLNRKNSRQ